MITLSYSKHYLRSKRKYIYHNAVRARILNKTLAYFVDKPNHPSLNLEKLGSTKVWSIRLTQGDRIFFTWDDDKTAVLIDIGKHDKYRRY